MAFSQVVAACSLFLTLLSQLTVAEEEVVWPSKEPSMADCPECAFGSWTCPYQCNSGIVPRYFDFNDVDGMGCWRQVFVSANTMAVEVDFRCHTRNRKLTCDEMKGNTFMDTSMLKGCHPKIAGSGDLFTERCEFICKDDGKPVQRCEWTFDPNGRFAGNYGPLEGCWVLPQCDQADADGDIEVYSVCKPTAAWRNASTLAAEVANAGADLTKSLEGARKVEKAVWKALSQLDDAQAALNDAQAVADASKPGQAEQNGTADAATAEMATYRDAVDALREARADWEGRQREVEAAEDLFLNSSQAVDAAMRRLNATAAHLSDESYRANSLEDLVASRRAASQQLGAVERRLGDLKENLPESGSSVYNVTVQSLASVDESAQELEDVLSRLSARLEAQQAEEQAPASEEDKSKAGPALLAVAICTALALGGAATGAAALRIRRRRAEAAAAAASATARLRSSAGGSPGSDGKSTAGVVTGHPAESVCLGHPVILGASAHRAAAGDAHFEDVEAGVKLPAADVAASSSAGAGKDNC